MTAGACQFGNNGPDEMMNGADTDRFNQAAWFSFQGIDQLLVESGVKRRVMFSRSSASNDV